MEHSRAGTRRRLLAAAAGAAVAVAAGRAPAFPDEPVDEVWLRHDETAASGLDHGPWRRFLGAHLVRGEDGIARVRYGDVGAGDRRLLRDYLALLAATPITRRSRSEQFAYWINLYNALTVELILEHYPVSSPRDIGGSLFRPGPWGEDIVEVEGRALSLDDIEHGILRPIWRDARIHYALNCASLGCPDLAARPYERRDLDNRLDAAAADYVNHPRGAAVDADGRLVVSSIFDWYEEDFGGDDAGVIAHLRRHARPPLAAALARIGAIHDDRYDWSLNDATGQPPPAAAATSDGGSR